MQYIREKKHKPHSGTTLGVALSGGGARGLAHAGALKAIEDAGLSVDIISGVSAGSVVAVLYAAGLRPEAILNIFSEARFLDLAEFTIGKGGILRIDKFENLISRCLGKYHRLEDLPIPTYIGVTNLYTGEPEVFSTGKIAPVVKASCSIPVAILPVEIGGTTYVDGGVVRNLPAWPIREKCDKLIGISVSTVLNKKPRNSLLGMAMRSYTLLARTNQAQDLAMCDLAVKMDGLSNHNVFDLRHLEDVYNLGYESMKAALADFKI